MRKRLLCLLLLFSLAFSMTACQQQQEKFQVPVNFYFPRQEVTYGSSDSLIAPVTAEGMGYAKDPVGLLTVYLQGPKDSRYLSPFPAGTQIVSMEQANSIVRLTMNENFATLTGLDLTLACACLTLTVLDLTDASSVRISVAGTTLNGESYIRMDRECLSLLDIIDNDSP